MLLKQTHREILHLYIYCIDGEFPGVFALVTLENCIDGEFPGVFALVTLENFLSVKL